MKNMNEFVTIVYSCIKGKGPQKAEIGYNSVRSFKNSVIFLAYCYAVDNMQALVSQSRFHPCSILKKKDKLSYYLRL